MSTSDRSQVAAQFAPASPAAACLQAGIEQLALPLGPALAGRLLDFLAELAWWNRRVNLTAVRDPTEMVRRHLLDSLSVLPFIDDDRDGSAGEYGAAPGSQSGESGVPDILDVGAGAGLPGLAIALCRPARIVVPLDSAARKVRFMVHAVGRFGIGNARPAHARVQEHLAPTPGYMLVISRAFATPPALLHAAGSQVRPGGRCLAMCGSVSRQAVHECEALGWRVRQHPLEVPGIRERNLLVMERAV